MSLLAILAAVILIALAFLAWRAYQKKSAATERFQSSCKKTDDDYDDKDDKKDRKRHKKHEDDDSDSDSDSDDADSERNEDDEDDDDKHEEDPLGVYGCNEDVGDDDGFDAGCGSSSARKRVVDAFIDVIGRSPTPREVCVYVQPDLAGASTADLRRAISKDYAFKNAPDSKKGDSSSSAEPEPYSTTTALAVSSVVRPMPDRSGSMKRPKSMLIQRADLLKRLDAISAEVDQFRQYVEMM